MPRSFTIPTIANIKPKSKTCRTMPGSSKVCRFGALSRKSVFGRAFASCGFPSDACFLDWACAGKALFLGPKVHRTKRRFLLTRFAAILRASSCWVKKRLFARNSGKYCFFAQQNLAHPEGPGIWFFLGRSSSLHIANHNPF